MVAPPPFSEQPPPPNNSEPAVHKTGLYVSTVRTHSISLPSPPCLLPTAARVRTSQPLYRRCVRGGSNHVARHAITYSQASDAARISIRPALALAFPASRRSRTYQSGWPEIPCTWQSLALGTADAPNPKYFLSGMGRSHCALFGSYVTTSGSLTSGEALL